MYSDYETTASLSIEYGVPTYAEISFLPNPYAVTVPYEMFLFFRLSIRIKNTCKAPKCYESL